MARAPMGCRAARRALNNADLLQRIAATLRQDVGSAVDDEYAKTQAFMAAVVLQKVARELASAEAHRVADAAAYRELATELAALRLGASVAAAVQRFRETPAPTSLSELIAAVYGARSELGDTFEPLLSRVRRTLRAVLDRRLEYAR